MSSSLAAGFSWLTPLLAAALLADRGEEVFARIARGDQRALKTLYEWVSPRAMAMALRLLKDRSEAEDVVQEAFIEVWRRASQFEATRGGGEAFVLTIVRSRAIDRLRARGSSHRTVQRAGSEPAPEPAPAPNDLAGVQQSRQRVLAALGGLPLEQRQVVELAYYEGLTQSEIAARIKEPLGTIKTRTRLAMAKLAFLLASEEDAA